MSKCHNKKNELNRREALMLALASGGGIGLRSLLTGLPIHFLTRRSMANTGGKFLVYAARRAGDPVNCNVPGTYKAGYDHADEYSTPVNMRIGNQTHQAAPVWDTLRAGIKSSANFFHLRSRTNSHNELDSVMKVFGAIDAIEGRGSEMLPSVIAHEMSKLLGTQLTSPLALGGILSYKGRNQQVYRPTNIKSLFPSNMSNAVVNARRFRDQQIDLIYRDLKSNGTPAQKRFIDNHIVSGSRARQLGNQLAAELESINGNGANDTMRTAAALIALKVAPVVSLELDFGGDNHGDSQLANEVRRHESGITAINELYDALSGYGIADQTIFSMLNVFGRTPQRNSRGGRDHWGPQSIMFSFGAGVRGGMIGDIARGGRRNRFEALGINSDTGLTQNPDIDPNFTLHSAAKSLIAATGIEENKVNEMVNGGKIVKAYTT